MALCTRARAPDAPSDVEVPVLCTIHQPSSEIFAMFDDVLILHEGQAREGTRTRARECRGVGSVRDGGPGVLREPKQYVGGSLAIACG